MSDHLEIEEIEALECFIRLGHPINKLLVLNLI